MLSKRPSHHFRMFDRFAEKTTTSATILFFWGKIWWPLQFDTYFFRRFASVIPAVFRMEFFLRNLIPRCFAFEGNNCLMRPQIVLYQNWQHYHSSIRFAMMGMLKHQHKIKHADVYKISWLTRTSLSPQIHCIHCLSRNKLTPLCFSLRAHILWYCLLKENRGLHTTIRRLNKQ